MKARARLQSEGVDRGEIELSDGPCVAYRPVHPEDAHVLQRFHRRLSPHSVYLRFGGPVMAGSPLPKWEAPGIWP